MSSPAAQPISDAPDAFLEKRTKRLTTYVFVLAVLLLLSVISGIVAIRWKLKALEKTQEDLAFDQAVADYNNRQDFVTPVVNTIQFLRRGYSITFDKVEYTQNGLLLQGNIGNPTQLWLSSLALSFSARLYPYKFRDKFTKEDFFFLYGTRMDIGSAQTTVGTLTPGATSPFEVTIPNVRQTSDDVEIAVSFSGERYQYLGK